MRVSEREIDTETAARGVELKVDKRYEPAGFAIQSRKRPLKSEPSEFTNASSPKCALHCVSVDTVYHDAKHYLLAVSVPRVQVAVAGANIEAPV